MTVLHTDIVTVGQIVDAYIDTVMTVLHTDIVTVGQIVDAYIDTVMTVLHTDTGDFKKEKLLYFTVMLLYYSVLPVETKTL